MIEEDVAMPPKPRGGGQPHRRRWRIPKFGAVIALFRVECLDDGGSGAQADVQFLEDVVVDEVELNVFVTAALAGSRILFSQEVQFETRSCIRRRVGRRGLLLFPDAVRCGLRSLGGER